MSLKIHYAVVRDTLSVLQTSDFTRTNLKYGSSGSPVALGADFPNGQLAGHIAVHTGPFEIGVMSSDFDRPIGLFINDAAGSPFENTPAVGSGKSPVVSGSGSVVEVDIFESFERDNSTPATYPIGFTIRGSANGLATTDSPGGISPIVGSVYRPPGTAGLLAIRVIESVG